MKKSEEKVTAKEEAVKAGAKVSEKAEEVKAPAAKKAAAPKKAAAKKETAKKETIKKTTTRKTAAKTAPAKTEAAAAETAPAAEAKPAKAPAKRAAKKSTEVKGNVTVQFSGKSFYKFQRMKFRLTVETHGACAGDRKRNLVLQYNIDTKLFGGFHLFG